MNYTPLARCEQEYRRYKAHFEALPRAPCSVCLFALKVESQSYWTSVWNRCLSFWNRRCFNFSHQHSRFFHLLKSLNVQWSLMSPLLRSLCVAESIRALRIQKKIIRLWVITGLKRLESCRQKFKDNKILTVTSTYILEVLCLTRKHSGVVKRNYEIHEHNTRNNYDLHIQPHNTSLLQKCVLHMGVRLYKQLPMRIKNLDTHKYIRKNVKFILLQNMIYKLEEYLQDTFE